MTFSYSTVHHHLGLRTAGCDDAQLPWAHAWWPRRAPDAGDPHVGATSGDWKRSLTATAPVLDSPAPSIVVKSRQSTRLIAMKQMSSAMRIRSQERANPTRDILAEMDQVVPGTCSRKR